MRVMLKVMHASHAQGRACQACSRHHALNARTAKQARHQQSGWVCGGAAFTLLEAHVTLIRTFTLLEAHAFALLEAQVTLIRTS